MTRLTILILFINLSLTNPVCLGQPSDSSQITNITLDSKGQLKWMYYFPGDSVSQIIESLENNEWKTIHSFTTSTILKIGKIEGRTYETIRVKLHTGRNVLRIKVIKPYLATSKPVEIYNSKPDIFEFNPMEITDTISFSIPTSYELFNKRHKSVRKGFGTYADLTTLTRGSYYLQIDTVKNWTKIIKK